jgi:hypothetical protein
VNRIIVLFNLKPGASAADYEAWARRVDMPTVKGLPSIERFEVFKSLGMLGSHTSPPYQYVEIIDVRDMDVFSNDIATSTMQAVAREFAAFADAVFILTKPLS